MDPRVMTQGGRIEGRLIVDSPAPGDWNMAVDQALLEEVDGGGPATLRFYAWDEPTLSLGYFQRAEARSEHRESGSAALVRRATGGGAILHDVELTYSLCVPIRDRASAEVRTVYDSMHRSITAALADFGVRVQRFADSAAPLPEGPPGGAEPFLCFQRRTDEDLILAGYKIAGSAQRRAAAAVLQHGSVLLSASRLAPQLPGIRQLSSANLAFDALASRIAHHAGQELSAVWNALPLSARARDRAAEIVAERFAADSWNLRR
ncbi:lipoate--protein ligase family protein [Candidatus Laterigemmans baculatus]|uniref:lipoate--protein ligase family protein n=1 Tax=Candidatus Laterigemmans baculatus TaxID=2770505 RepID=UPI0013DAFA25|nr:lipoate--protein ligase family protein [Candidatus Laterigemmans baculatus]